MSPTKQTALLSVTRLEAQSLTVCSHTRSTSKGATMRMCVLYECMRQHSWAHTVTHTTHLLKIYLREDHRIYTIIGSEWGKLIQILMINSAIIQCLEADTTADVLLCSTRHVKRCKIKSTHLFKIKQRGKSVWPPRSPSAPSPPFFFCFCAMASPPLLCSTLRYHGN